jgi:mitogen-activated protein kinase organizer 1
MRPIQVLEDARDSITSVAAVGWNILSGSVDGRLRTYDIRMGVLSTDVLGGPITSLSPSLIPSTASSVILVASQGSPLRLFDRSTGLGLKKYEADDFENEEFRLRAALAFADKYVISGSENGSIYVWNAFSGALDTCIDNPHKNCVVGVIAVREGINGRKAESGIWVSAGVDGKTMTFANQNNN